MFEEYVSISKQLIKVKEAAQEYKVYPVQIRRALTFDGVDDYINLGNKPSLHFTTPFTITCWIRLAEIPDADWEIIVGDYNGDYRGYRLWVQTDGRVAFSVGRKSDNTIIQVNSTQVLSATRWFFICGQYDGTRAKVFVNCVETSGTPYSPIEAEGGDILIGRAKWIARFFNGIIDEVRIYNHALSAIKITWLYNNGKGRPGRVGIREGCVLCLDPSRWRGAGWVKDISGFGNHGQIYGARRVRRDF